MNQPTKKTYNKTCATSKEEEEEEEEKKKKKKKKNVGGFNKLYSNEPTPLILMQLLITNIHEPARDKTYNKTCATSEDSDQPAHPRRLIRVFADRMCLLQTPCYPKHHENMPI